MNYYDTYDYMYRTTADSMITGIVAVYLIALMVWLLFYIISYVFKGIGMYTIAKRQGMDYPWLAFIPFARKYLQGELGGRITLKSRSIKNPGIWLLVMPFIFGVVNFVLYMVFWVIGVGAFANIVSNYEFGYNYGTPHIGGGMILGLLVLAIIWIIVAVIYSAVYKVLAVLVNHQILEKFTSKNMSIAHAVLCIFIPLYESICFFVMRNRDFNPGMEPDLGRPFIQVQPPVMPPEGTPGPGPYTASDAQVPPVAQKPSVDGDVSQDESSEENIPVVDGQTVIELPQSPTEQGAPSSEGSDTRESDTQELDIKE